MSTTRATATRLPAARQRSMSSRISFIREITSAELLQRRPTEWPSTNSSTYGRAAAIPWASGA